MSVRKTGPRSVSKQRGVNHAFWRARTFCAQTLEFFAIILYRTKTDNKFRKLNILN